MSTTPAPNVRPRGFAAGLLAGLPMIALMLALSSAIRLPPLPELLADPILFLVPGPIFGLMIDLLQFGAKTLLLAFLLEGQLLVCGFVGRYWAARSGADPAQHWRGALVVVGVLFVVVEVLLLPLLGGGIFGAALPPGAVGSTLGLAAIHGTYAVALVAIFRLLTPREPAGAVAPNADRRRFLTTLGATTLAVVGGGTLWRALSGVPIAGATVGERETRIPDEVTPTERFYTVSKNFTDPSVDASSWQLEIAGHVERPMVMTFDQIKALPARDQYFTLTCISNLVGGDLIGNAAWRGVPLRDLLNAAGVRPGARKVVFHAADGYTDSILPEKALEERTLLAYEMNGAPLTDKHGFPTRLLVPNIYGMKNVKWITKIEVLDHGFSGYWQQKGWNDEAVIQTMSRIDVPAEREALGGPVTIGGIAHAGTRGIARVEVSVDDGRTWMDAQLSPPLSPDSWTVWRLPWSPAPGAYSLLVRATDGIGRVQVATRTDSFPNGATGWDGVRVRVLTA